MDEEVKDQELDAAAEEAVEDTPVEDAEETHEEEKEEGAEEEEGTEEIAEEPKDNVERSRLGRKVSGLETQLANLESQLLAAQADAETQEDIDEDVPMTLKELKVFMAKEAETKTVTKQKYDNDYIREFIKLSEEEDETFANEVMKEMETNFNSVYSKNGTEDAEKNWLKAQNAVLRKGSERKNPLKGEKPRAALGVTGGDKVHDREYTIPKLDKDAMDLISRSNFTEADIKDALSSTKHMKSTGYKEMKDV